MLGPYKFQQTTNGSRPSTTPFRRRRGTEASRATSVADIVGYGRLAGADEERTLARLRALRSDLIDPTIAVHHRRIVKRTGDGSLIEFRSVVDAVRCAIEVQHGLAERNAGLPPERRIEFRATLQCTTINPLPSPKSIVFGARGMSRLMLKSAKRAWLT